MNETSRSGTLESINIGVPRTITYRGKSLQTGIWKSPVDGPVPVRGVHVGDDVQADPTVHGGPTKSVYAYAAEDLEWWGAKLERPLEPGTFGENLTIRGLAVSHSIVGEQWLVGSTLLQVTEPRLPCFKLGIKMGDGRFPKRFGKAALFGAYFTILEEGVIQTGDLVNVVHRPSHGVTVAMMGRMRLGEPHLAEDVARAPEIPERWRQIAEMFRERTFA